MNMEIYSSLKGSGTGTTYLGKKSCIDGAISNNFKEDFPAHSNFCELVLNELGYNDVFPQVGIQTNIGLNGRNVYPLTTGTFGG